MVPVAGSYVEPPPSDSPASLASRTNVGSPSGESMVPDGTTAPHAAPATRATDIQARQAMFRGADGVLNFTAILEKLGAIRIVMVR